MSSRSLPFHKIILGTVLFLWLHSVTGAMLSEAESLNSLYNKLLQRESVDPLSFTYNQLERKAQRSPSMRLRFGRRSDSEMPTQLPEKRWFGYVTQKSIRSPSLRLRFGRRSDPAMAQNSGLDTMMNSGPATDNNYDDDYNDITGGQFDRVVRKPQRLRFGRSVSQPTAVTQQSDENALNAGNVDDSLNRLRTLLMFLRLYGDVNDDDLMQDVDSMVLENYLNKFERNIRKPASMRLRFGRSIAGVVGQTQDRDGDKKTNVQLEKEETVSSPSSKID